MRSQMLLRFGQLLLLGCALHLAICNGQYCNYEDIGDDIAADCPEKEDHFAVETNDCMPRYYCYLRLNQTCQNYQVESQCEKGLTCSCNKCMNCDKHDNCYMELCPFYNNNINKKHVPLLPWNLPRWLQVLASYKYPPAYLYKAPKTSPLRRPHRPWTSPSPNYIRVY